MQPPTAIATSNEESLTVRGKYPTAELVSNYDFPEFFLFHLTGNEPTESERHLFNAILVTIAEQGITPSVIFSRLMYDYVPEAV